MKKVCVYFLVAAMTPCVFTGCENAGQTAVLGTVLNGIGDFAPGLSGQARGVLHFAAGVAFTISAVQARQAEENARAALANASFRRRLEESNERYIAVPVTPTAEQQKTKAKHMVVLYDTKEEKVVDKAYAPKEKNYAKGQEVTFGSKKAVVASSFSGI